MIYLWKGLCIVSNLKDFVNNFDLSNYEKNVLGGVKWNLFLKFLLFKSFRLCIKFKLKLYKDEKTNYLDMQHIIILNGTWIIYTFTYPG